MLNSNIYLIVVLWKWLKNGDSKNVAHLWYLNVHIWIKADMFIYNITGNYINTCQVSKLKQKNDLNKHIRIWLYVFVMIRM